MLKYRDYFNLRFRNKWEPFERYTYVSNDDIVGTMYKGTQYWRFKERMAVVIFEPTGDLHDLLDTHHSLPFSMWTLGLLWGWRNVKI